MRKVVLALVAAGSALAAATPAAAQYYPQAYGYDGYNNWGEVRALQARIDAVERQIRGLDRRDVIGDRTADQLRHDANNIERSLHRAARNGLNPNEANQIQWRISRLEQRVQRSVAYGYGRNGYRDRDDRWGHDRD
jgi:hypothetical protein